MAHRSLNWLRGNAARPSQCALISVRAILAVTLRMIKRAIGCANNGLGRVKRRGVRRETNADGNRAEWLGVAVRKLCLRDFSPNAIRDHAGFMQVGLRQQNGKLFAAIARSYVNFSERRSQTLRND